MGIYRGPGGTGDAVNDAASEALITVQAKDAALAAQAAAEAAQTAAELAETNAETAETNAETAETNAETAATNAASSASAASTSASNAATSATNAANSATAAQTAETNAETAETNAAASASAASTSASNAATSATNASNSASAASTSATNASNSASAAATSATNAANSATAAQTAQTAAELAETNAETAEANAETAEANSAASASAAATSASNASTSASNAATSATNASNSASAAATSATNASNSASAAATSATNASNSASAAATSASNAAASYDSFDDRYLGAKSSAPTLDNDGNTLLTGALYYDTVSSSMKVWSGSAWLDAYASLSGALLATNNLSDLNNTATARTNLGVAIGTDVQAYDADTAKLDVAQSWSAAQSFNAGVTLGDASGDALTINSSAVSVPNGLNFDSNTLVIDATNNRVGVGIASPTTPLDITGTVGSVLSYVYPTSQTTNAVQSIIKLGGHSTNSSRAVQIACTNGASNDINQMALYYGYASTLYEGMRISGDNSSAYVGINKTAPVEALDVAGNIRISDGLSLQYGGTANKITGSNTSNYLAFSTSSSERMRITSTGNVGIGTSSPFGTATNRTVLSVNGTSTVSLNIGTGGSQRLNLYSDGTIGQVTTIGSLPLVFAPNDTERMRIDSSGNVGIGTSSPGAKLHVVGTSYLNVSGAGTQQVLQLNNSDTTAGTQAVKLGFSSSGVTKASINAAVYGNDYMTFNVGSDTERMRIDSSGNVGIGTSSPTAGYKLDVIGATRIQGSVVADAVGGADFRSTNGTVSVRMGIGTYFGTGLATLGVDGANPLTFVTNTAERMRIDSSGRVLIGATADIGNTPLQIATTGSPLLTCQLSSGSANDYSLGGFLGYDGSNLNGDVIVRRESSTTTGYIAFRTNSGSGITERARITSGGNFQFNSGYGSVATAYGCRAWVNFNGSGTVSIRASGNVSSITDNGTGDYTVNFTNAMPNTNYSVSGSCGRNGSGANANILSVADNTSAPTTSAVRVNTRGDNGTSTDIDLVSVMVYR